MGDHTDYSHLPVLPIAIQYGVDIGAAPRSDRMVVAHSLVAGTTARISLDHPGTQQGMDGWGRYVQGAVKSVANRNSGDGVSILVAGDLPTTGGLSSSSALTVGLISAFNRVWDLGLDPTEVAGRAIEAERHVGVESGGMDQTVIAFARRGHALRIDFDPPALEHVAIPDQIGIAVGYSGEAAPKGGHVRDLYNRSVVSCRVASILLSRLLDRPTSDIPMLAEFEGVGPEVLARLPRSTTARRVAALCDYPEDALVGLTGGRFPHDVELPVREVAAHVLSEANRVDEAVNALRTSDGVALGNVFDRSHASLSRFGSVTPGLDRVCTAARRAGAWGARVTGAGFGGWAVAVCSVDDVDAVRAGMASASGGPTLAVEASEGVR